MAYVLVWLMGMNSAYLGDFDSLEACQAAAKLVLEIQRSGGSDFRQNAVQCLAKRIR